MSPVEPGPAVDAPPPAPRRRSTRALLGLVALATLAPAALGAGCDSLRGSAHPEAPLWLHHPGTALAVSLRRTITAEPRRVGEPYERGRPEIDALNRRLFVGSSDHGLYALHADSLETLWRFETLGPVQTEPLYDPGEDVVYFGSNDGALYKVRALDGKLLWRFMTNSELARRPALRDGWLYATNANDTLLALDASTGQMRWHHHRTPAFGMEVAGHAGAALGRDKVYTAFSDGTVQAFSLEDGTERWPTVDLSADAEQLAGEAPRYLDVDTTPIFGQIRTGDVVYVAGYAGGVFALDAENGSRAWHNEKALGVTDLTMWTQPAHRARGEDGAVVRAQRLLLASSGLTGLWALDPENGRAVWHRDLPQGGISAAVPISGAVLVTTTQYGFFLFSPLDGAVIDGIDSGGGIAMTPAAHGQRAFVLTNGGTLLGITVEPPRGPGVRL